MKKLFYLFAVTMLFAACSKENDGIEKKWETDEGENE